jgi:hypothetical protein
LFSLLHVRPTDASPNGIDGCCPDPEAASDAVGALSPPECPNLAHKGGREFGLRSALGVLRVCYRLDVVRIHAGSLPAEVVKLHAARDRPPESFVNDTMGIQATHGPISGIGIDGPLPNPTGGFVAPIFLDPFDGGAAQSGTVPTQKPLRLPLDMTEFGPVALSDRRRATAPTLTQTEGDGGIFRGHSADLLLRSVGCRGRGVRSAAGRSRCPNYTGKAG